MNNALLINIIRFILLVFLQVIIFNNVNLFGYLNPYVYIIFIILFPFTANQVNFMLVSFLLGLSIDLFLNSGGVHAAACLTVAYLRPTILGYSFGVSYEYQNIKFTKMGLKERLLYMVLIILIHHLVLFLLEIFNIEYILMILKKTLFSSIFSLIVIFLLLSLFSRKN